MILLLKKFIHAAHTAEPGRHRDVQNGQRGIGQQLLRQQKAAGLQILHRRHMAGLPENAAEMAVGAPQLTGQGRQIYPASAVFPQQPGCPPGQLR